MNNSQERIVELIEEFIEQNPTPSNQIYAAQTGPYPAGNGKPKKRLSKWNLFLKDFMKQNPGMKFRDAVKEASKSFKNDTLRNAPSGGGPSEAPRDVADDIQELVQDAKKNVKFSERAIIGEGLKRKKNTKFEKIIDKQARKARENILGGIPIAGQLGGVGIAGQLVGGESNPNTQRVGRIARKQNIFFDPNNEARDEVTELFEEQAGGCDNCEMYESDEMEEMDEPLIMSDKMFRELMREIKVDLMKDDKKTDKKIKMKADKKEVKEKTNKKEEKKTDKKDKKADKKEEGGKTGKATKKNGRGKSENLKMWREALKQFNKNKKYSIPKRGTKEHKEVTDIYHKLLKKE